MSPADVGVKSDDPKVCGPQRIDKWLWYARIVKTRTLATTLVQSGKVRLNRNRIEKASQPVRPGDVVTITAHHKVLVLKVLLPGTRRGPAIEAQTLYEDMTPDSAKAGPRGPGPRSRDAAEGAIAERDAGTGRPTKRDRRVLDRWRQQRDE